MYLPLSPTFFSSVLLSSFLRLSWRVPLTLAVVALLLYVRSMWVVSESCLVVRGVGVQLTTHFASGRRSTRFVDAGAVQGAVINEGVTAWRIITYVALVLRGPLRPGQASGRPGRLELPFSCFLPSDPDVIKDMYYKLNEVFLQK